MTNCKDVKFCVIEMLSKYNIKMHPKDYPKIVIILTEYVDKLIFNIIAVTCIICMQIGVRRLLKEHVEHLQGYIHKRCKLGITKRTNRQLMAGGSAFNTAAFYGVPEPQYSARNAGTDVMNIDWNNNIARPMLASTMTGGKRMSNNTVTVVEPKRRKSCDKVYKVVETEIYRVFKFFKVHANKYIRKEFVNIFYRYMTELFTHLAKSKGLLKVQKLRHMLKKSKIMQKK